MKALEKRVGNLLGEVREYNRSLQATRSHDWKLIRGSDGSTELYHIAEGPDELKNLASECPGKVSKLESELDRWLDYLKHANATGDVNMSDSTKDRLEDLGYLQ